MTPEQKLKHLILIKHASYGNDYTVPEVVTAETIDEQYEQADEEEGGWLQDAINEVRCSGIETDIPAPWSRHYESESVAAQYIDGSWVGWTYWYGGGKHGEPEAIDWMDEAYDLSCTEEQVVVTQRSFEKLESA